MSRNNKHTEFAFKQLVAYGKGRDSLPYSEHFELMYEEFPRLLGYAMEVGGAASCTGPSGRDYWHTLAAAAKKGGLQEARRVKPAVGEAYVPCEGQMEMFDSEPQIVHTEPAGDWYIASDGDDE